MSTTLKLYNTLTRTKEAFVPLDPSHVRMYVCGPTVYDYAHIGNARPMIVFDVLFRLLRHLAGQGAFDGGKGLTRVTYARNITDVDDKINARAFERWTRKRPLLAEMRELTEGTVAQFNKDLKALNVLAAEDVNVPGSNATFLTPRATEYVAEGENHDGMIGIIRKLIDREVAYPAEGHVLFSPKEMDARFPGLRYGALSRRSLDDMIAGARVDVAPYKRDPMDFVLWKPSDPESEPGWESPWGYGRPGWHIECSAMAGALLGKTFDIHAGGIDLVFPHHENEIAQSCCAFGVEKMASVWMHNGFLQVEGQKMSKSLGNFVTIDDLLKTTKFGGRSWPGPVLRLAMLKTHYLQPIDWTVRALEESEKNLARWSRHIDYLKPTSAQEKLDARFLNRLLNDLNVPFAIAVMNEISAEASGPGMVGGPPPAAPDHPVEVRREAAGRLLACLKLMGIWQEGTSFSRSDAGKIESLIAARLEARRNKDFASSDRIRDELAAMGIQLKDGKDADGNQVTTWEVKR